MHYLKQECAFQFFDFSIFFTQHFKDCFYSYKTELQVIESVINQILKSHPIWVHQFLAGQLAESNDYL